MCRRVAKWKVSRTTGRPHALAGQGRPGGDGDHHTPAKLDRGPAPAWDLWRRIAPKDPSFGRPAVVPKGSVNFAFIGQFAESGRDCIFTIEYSVRTPMEAVYQLLEVERGVPEVFNSTYDVRTLLAASARLRDNEEVSLPLPAFARDRLVRRLGRSQLGQLLEASGLLGR
jgi:myosin-crossreactive antigen